MSGVIEPSRRYRVIKDYQASNPNPFSVSAGETFQVSERSEAWNGNPDWIWVWCTDQRGKSGWAPQNLIALHPDGTTGTARYTYTAAELTVAAGDELVASKEKNGWLWCSDRQGNNGWIPLDSLTLVSDETGG